MSEPPPGFGLHDALLSELVKSGYLRLTGWQMPDHDQDTLSPNVHKHHFDGWDEETVGKYHRSCEPVFVRVTSSPPQSQPEPDTGGVDA